MPVLLNYIHSSLRVLAASRLRCCLLLAIGVVSVLPAAASEVTLAWDPNGESNLAGYGVYFRVAEDGPPYELYGYVALDELADEQAPTFTVDGLEKGLRYWFAVTAYNTIDNESGFSNSVCADIGDTVKPCGGPVAAEPQEPDPDVPKPLDPSLPPEPEPPPPNPSEPQPVSPEPVEPQPIEPAPVEPQPIESEPDDRPDAEEKPAVDEPDKNPSWDELSLDFLTSLLELILLFLKSGSV